MFLHCQACQCAVNGIVHYNSHHMSAHAMHDACPDLPVYASNGPARVCRNTDNHWIIFKKLQVLEKAVEKNYECVRVNQQNGSGNHSVKETPLVTTCCSLSKLYVCIMHSTEQPPARFNFRKARSLDDIQRRANRNPTHLASYDN